MILSLDLATRTGWAAWRPGDATPRFGVNVLPKTGKDVGWFVETYEQWLTDMLTVERAERVVFEAPYVGGITSQDTARKLLGLAVVTELVCRRLQKNGRPELRYFEVNNASVRKHFIGKGNGERAVLKRLTMDACRQRGWQVRSDDEADALAVLDYAAHCFKVDVPWPCGPMFGAAA